MFVATYNEVVFIFQKSSKSRSSSSKTFGVSSKTFLSFGRVLEGFWKD